MRLRDYQSEAIDAIYRWWGTRKGEHPLLVLATGLGKTFTTVALIRRLLREHAGTRILILAHRKELLAQFERSIFHHWPFAPVGVYCAGLNRREYNTITIASRDSLARKPQQLGRFDLVIVDEAHNIDTRQETSYRKILAALRSLNPKLSVLGLTATPYRLSSGLIYGKDRLFAGVAFERNLKWGIDNGYLVRPVSKRLETTIDTTGIRTTAGDFNQGQLDAAASHDETIGACLDEWERVAVAEGRRSTAFYCVTVHHAELVSEALRQRGFNCPVVTGETDKSERDGLLEAFALRQIPGIVTVGILTEGTDIPAIDCIALLRPTKSLGLFVQIVGRGLRLFPDKENCLLLDFGGCLQRFGPVDIAQPPERGDDNRTKDCPGCATVVGIFKRSCPECGYELMAPPCKICPECGEENSPGVRCCVACGYQWPVELTETAATDAVLSDDVKPLIEAFPVKYQFLRVCQARRTGQDYLRITYVVDELNRFHKNLMIGYGGFVGRKAEKELAGLLLDPADAELFTTPDEVVAANKAGKIFRPVHTVHVDMRTKYQEIVRVEFSEETDHAVNA